MRFGIDYEVTATGLCLRLVDAAGQEVGRRMLSAADSLELAGQILDAHRGEVAELMRLSPTANPEKRPAPPLAERWQLLELSEEPTIADLRTLREIVVDTQFASPFFPRRV